MNKTSIDSLCKGCEAGLTRHGGDNYWYHRDETGFFDSYCTKERTVTEEVGKDELDEAGAFRAVSIALQREITEKERELIQVKDENDSLKSSTQSCHEEHVRTENDLAHCRDIGNSLQKQLDERDAALAKINSKYEWLWAKCRIVFYPPMNKGLPYPIEHAPGAFKNSRQWIEAEMAAQIKAEEDRRFGQPHYGHDSE